MTLEQVFGILLFMVREDPRANLPPLEDVIKDLRAVLARLEPSCLGGSEAAAPR